MKIKHILSLMFALAAVALMGLTLWVCRDALDAQPVLKKVPYAASETADAMLAAVKAGDYKTASGMMYGSPDLGADREPSDEVGRILWDAFQDSFSYELQGECYATDSGIAQDVTVTYLDFSSVTASLRQRSQELLVQRVEQAEDADTIYDESGDYLEEFVMEVLRDVTLDALEEDAKTTQQQLTVNLVCKQGRWWIMADQALLSAISGGVAG